MSETALFAAGLPVDVGEWRLFLQRNRASALSFLMKQGVVVPSATAEEELKRHALKELVPVKQAQVWMLRLGVIADAGYAAFIREWQQENERRTAALRRGEPVYGPKQYRAEDYYFHLHRLRLNGLAERLRMAEPVSEEELAAWYLREKERDPALRRPDVLTAEVYRAPAAYRITEVKEVLMNSAPAETVTLEKPDRGGAWSVYELLAPLEEGGRSDIVITRDGYLQYRLVKREQGAFYTLEEDRAFIGRCYAGCRMWERIREIPEDVRLLPPAKAEALDIISPLPPSES